jgi:hypothetical protein
MKTFVIVTASILGAAGAAVAADLPVRQPVPPPQTTATPLPLVGKMPIGKMPIGKWPVGKSPAVFFPPPPPPAPPPVPPIVTRG